MHRFYFHFLQGGVYQADEEGCPFASADEAYLGAVAASQELWRELLIRREDPRECAFVVTDAKGYELFTLPFSEILDACKSASVIGRVREGVREPVAVAVERGRSAHQVVNDVSTVVRETRDALRETAQLMQQVSTAADFDPFRAVSGAGGGGNLP